MEYLTCENCSNHATYIAYDVNDPYNVVEHALCPVHSRNTPMGWVDADVLFSFQLTNLKLQPVTRIIKKISK
jgi:hypothetical protein